MKPARVLIVAAILLVIVAVVVAFTPAFQTWAVRRALAAHPGLGLEVGHVSAGLSHVTLTNVHYAGDGVRIDAPIVEAELPVLAAVFLHRLNFRHLSATDCVIDASAIVALDVKTGSSTAEASAPHGGAASTTISSAFEGILSQLALPCDLSVAEVKLAGQIVLPRAVGRAQVELTGGGMRPGVDGNFEFTGSAAMKSRRIHAVAIKGTAAIAMDSPRTVARVAAKATITASGDAFAHGLELQSELSGARVGTGETYAFSISKPDHVLVALRAGYEAPGKPLTGRWKIDVRDGDVAPISPQRALPQFTAAGEGTLDTNAVVSEVHAVGRLEASVARLDALWPQLSEVGAITLSANVDVSQRGERLAVRKLDVTIGAKQPVATVTALQVFEFNPKTGELIAADAAHELLGIRLQALPIAWVKPFVPAVTLSGRDVHGELMATPHGGGLNVRTKSSLTAAALDVDYHGQPLLRQLDVSLNASGDYTPHGWQAEVNGTTAKSGSATALLLDARAGRLAGAGNPIKATGLLTVDLAAIATQPVASGLAKVEHGSASLEFAGSFGQMIQVDTKLGVKGAKLAGNKSPALPDIAATIRADVTDGRIALNAPIQLESTGRKSDIAFSGTIVGTGPTRKFEAQVGSNELVLDDAKAVAGLLGFGESTDGPKSGTPRGWSALDGSVALQLKHVVYSPAFELRNVTGTLRLSNGSLTLDNVHSGIGDGAEASADGRISYERDRPQPFIAEGKLALIDADAGWWSRSPADRAAFPVDGKFSVTTELRGRAETLPEVASATARRIDLTSRSGVFRGLAVNVGNLVENSSKLATWIASAGNTIAGLVGKKEDYDEITSRSQAASELAKALSSITYDQLNVRVDRDEALNSTVREFTLISPDFRLTGTGHARHTAGQSTLEDEVALDLQIRARGRPAELLKYLGVLEPKSDDLGYSACTIPVRVGGTVARPDARDFGNRLIALAVEKTGIIERAGARAMDWINRLRGK